MALENGFVEVEDMLELVRDAAAEGLLGGALTVADRNAATLHAGLQTFSYDVHVKLGMEVGYYEKICADAWRQAQRMQRSLVAISLLNHVYCTRIWYGRAVRRRVHRRSQARTLSVTCTAHRYTCCAARFRCPLQCTRTLRA